MPKSMTGYGRGECVSYERRIKVELKAVNHRFSDVTIKLPRFLNPFEERIRRRLAEDIIRGKVDVWISFESFAQKDVAVNVNVTLADAYVEALSGLCSRYGFQHLDTNPTIELLARGAEVITMERFDQSLSSDSDQAEVWETLSDSLEMALREFNQMRQTEGKAMAEDIANHKNQAQNLVGEITTMAPKALQAQSERYRDRIDEIVHRLNQKPDEMRLITEIAILTDKGCVSEEIARLESHLDQLANILKEEEPIGRKLDFLIQELNREANTIGSKSGDVTITTMVVDLKSLIEKMREQAQNIE